MVTGVRAKCQSTHFCLWKGRTLLCELLGSARCICAQRATVLSLHLFSVLTQAFLGQLTSRNATSLWSANYKVGYTCTAYANRNCHHAF